MLSAEVVHRYAPLVLVHADETLWPATAEWFVDHSDLRWATGRGREGEVVVGGAQRVDPSRLGAGFGSVQLQHVRREWTHAPARRHAAGSWWTAGRPGVLPRASGARGRLRRAGPGSVDGVLAVRRGSASRFVLDVLSGERAAARADASDRASRRPVRHTRAWRRPGCRRGGGRRRHPRRARGRLSGTRHPIDGPLAGHRPEHPAGAPARPGRRRGAAQRRSPPARGRLGAHHGLPGPRVARDPAARVGALPPACHVHVGAVERGREGAGGRRDASRRLLRHRQSCVVAGASVERHRRRRRARCPLGHVGGARVDRRAALVRLRRRVGPSREVPDATGPLGPGDNWKHPDPRPDP